MPWLVSWVLAGEVNGNNISLPESSEPELARSKIEAFDAQEKMLTYHEWALKVW